MRVWLPELGVALAALALQVRAVPPAAVPFVREPGRCAMYDSCGRKGFFGGEIPCPDNNLARNHTDPLYLTTLASVCGPTFAARTCCSLAQLDVLSSSLQQAEPLLATCPAARGNFRSFFCSFTCSPDQSLFLTVADTQELTTDGVTKTAVKAVDFSVATSFSQGFYDSAKDVKFGATNGLAMDLLGGGARNPLAFLRFMGQERALGSPFQISFPATSNGSGIVPFDPPPLLCSSLDIDARCACPDCPAVCAKLPHVVSPAQEYAARCRVGEMSCFSFVLVIVYGVLLLGFSLAYFLRRVKKGSSAWFSLWPKGKRGYDRVPMEDPADEPPRRPSARRASLSNGTTNAPATDVDSANSGRPPSGSSASSELAPNPFLQPRTYPLNTHFSNFFYALGLWCATRPYLNLAIGLAVCSIINLGWNQFEIETDPVKLWVARGSETELAKNEFDQAFGPFYRTEQIFISVAPPRIAEDVLPAKWEAVDAPVLNWQRLQWWASVEKDIRNLRSAPHNYTLTDVCFSPATDPLPPADASACVVQSIMGYLGDSLDGVDEDTWAPTLVDCASTPSNCLPGSSMPMNPKLLLGGVPPSKKADTTVRADEARALIVTYVVRNSLDEQVVARAEEWETTLQRYFQDLVPVAAELGLELAFSTGISLESELAKSASADVLIVVLSYAIMFGYISLNLGSSGAGLLKSTGRGLVALLKALSQLVQMLPVGASAGRARSASLSMVGSSFARRQLVESKFLLGLWAIAIVLLSVSTSVALFSVAGVKATLIIAQVIPFLILAIGVDNVFLLVHELDRQNERAHLQSAHPLFGDGNEEDVTSPEERVARTLGRMGPSILLSACCQTLAFGLGGAMVGMPAIRNFAIYAAGAVVVNFILQVTVFTSALVIDLRRVESNRIDCVPCLKLSSSSAADRSVASEGYVSHFIRTTYAPALLRKPVKLLVVAAFAGLFVVSWVGARHIELGLDQRLALPSGYLVDYFDALDEFLEVGPPVYFVAKGVDVRVRAVQQQICGRLSTCDPFSLANVLEAERKRPESSFIAEPPAVWLDDYFQWLNPLLEDCCRVRKKDASIFCTAADPDFLCRPCFEDSDPPWNITMEGLPQGDEFMRFLRQWLVSPTDETCPLGGKASYSSALSLDDSSVELSHFRTYHTPLKSQADFINALAAAQRVAADISLRTGAQVFPFSIFYVFFEQYSHIVATTREVLTLAIASIFLVTTLFLGSWRTAAVVSLAVLSSVVMVLGVMGVSKIDLNAIALVNLVISVGIAVEFCSHIARAFMGASGGGLPHDHPGGARDRDERAFVALVEAGPSVFSGITVTKLVGISVLGLTQSKLLQVYFFRQWLALIVSGALHGLVFLPVALSFQGGQGYALESEDADWLVNDITNRYEHDGRPFLADDESVDSEDRF